MADEETDLTTQRHRTPKAQATAAAIVEAAAARFLERGFGGTTIAAIAEDAGVATGTVLLHFDSKSGLATAAFSRHIGAAVEQAARSVPGTSAVDDLTHVVEALYGWYDEHAAVAPALLRESLFSTGPSAAVYNRVAMTTVEVFGQILASYRPDLDTPALTRHAEQAFASYLLVLIGSLRGLRGTPAEATHQFAALLDDIWR